jgi:hypothetical protein
MSQQIKLYVLLACNGLIVIVILSALIYMIWTVRNDSKKMLNDDSELFNP